MRICYSDAEITKMCTSGEDDLLICGTSLGSLVLFDLKDYDSVSFIAKFLNWEALLQYSIQQEGAPLDEKQQAGKLSALKAKYTPKTASFITDGMVEYPHFSPIEKLVLVSKIGAGSKQIGVLDQSGVVSMWSVLEMEEHIAEKMAEFELNMSMGSRFKLIENFNQDISATAVDTTGLELEFDKLDASKFYFGCSGGLYKVDRRISTEPSKMSNEGLGAPCSLSMSDDKYLLAGFSCGSVALYNTEFSSPITCWYNVSTHPITQIQWCALYFTDEAAVLGKGDSPQKVKRASGQEAKVSTRFATRLCEFFSIDQKEDFQIWNLNKAIHKPAHVIKFSDKHQG